MAKLITESNFDVTFKKEDKSMYIEGIFASAERKNDNNRIYPKKILEREYDKIMETVKNRTCMGELGHPENRSDISLQHAAILMEDMQWKNNDVHGRAKVLNTPMGGILKNLVEDGARVGVSTRGLGSVSEDGYVNDDYMWLTVDAVSNPSNPVSWVNGIYEGREFDLPKDLKDKHPSDQEVSEALEYHEKRIWQVLDSLEK